MVLSSDDVNSGTPAWQTNGKRPQIGLFMEFGNADSDHQNDQVLHLPEISALNKPKQLPHLSGRGLILNPKHSISDFEALVEKGQRRSEKIGKLPKIEYQGFKRLGDTAISFKKHDRMRKLEKMSDSKTQEAMIKIARLAQPLEHSVPVAAESESAINPKDDTGLIILHENTFAMPNEKVQGIAEDVTMEVALDSEVFYDKMEATEKIQMEVVDTEEIDLTKRYISSPMTLNVQTSRLPPIRSDQYTNISLGPWE